MKLTLFLSILTVIQLWATDTYSQMTKLTLKLEDVKISDVLKEIENESEFFFLYSPKLLDVEKRVNIDVQNQPIEDILTTIFGEKVKFAVYDRQIILIPNEQTEVLSAFQQQKLLTGTITDKNGPIPGANVVVTGTTIGTITDLNGKYTLTIPQGAESLTFTFIGMDPQKITIGTLTQIDVVMDESAIGLDEVVVIGYGTARRSEMVGSTSSVSAIDVVKQPVARVDQALQGISPGIMIQNTSSAPNSVISIRIRGSNSLKGSNDPLVVIDGFLGGSLSSINPNDIQNIEILKDASSTAIYGSRGANGVILVTTKKGSAKETVVEYNSYVNISSLAKKMDLLNAVEYAENVNAHRLAIGRPEPFTADQIAGFKLNGGTDWQDIVFRKAIQQSQQISLSGGSANNSYYISANYMTNEGIIKGSSFDRVSFRSNLESTISKKVKSGLNIYAEKTNDHPAVTNGSLDQSPVQAALLWDPTRQIYNENGGYTLPGGGVGPPAVYNPLALAVEPIKDYINVRGELNAFISIELLKGLSFRSTNGAVLSDSENDLYQNMAYNNYKGNALASITDSRYWLIQNTNQLNYLTTFADIHDINITVATEYQREDSESSLSSSSGFSSDVLTYNNLGIGTLPGIPKSDRTRKDILSYLARISYTIDDKYLFSINGRYDGASVFGDQKWGFFPSGAFAWRIDKEGFMESVNAISNLKLRASYGVTGSQAVSPYASLQKLNTNTPYPVSPIKPITGIGFQAMQNKDLRWEKTGQFNAGVDLGMYKGRVTFTVDFYNKITTDLLMDVPLPATSGYNSILRNIGAVQNKGFEFNISGDPFIGDFSWNTNFNFALNRNKILELSGVDEIPVGTTGFPSFGNTIFLVKGEPMGVLRGFIQDGCWGTGEAAAAAVYLSFPGAPKYIDQNKDGIINAADIATMGNTMPKFDYGWSNTVTYKNFDFNLLFQGTYGNKRYNLNRIRSERYSADADATDRRILNRWTENNQDTNVPSFLGSNKLEQVQSTRWLEDGSYLRMKNITLGYTLPSSLLQKIKIGSIRVSVSGVNLLTFTKYTGYDVESSTGVDAFNGIDLAPYPSATTYSFGINVKF